MSKAKGGVPATTFKLNEFIVYPTQGVGEITAITERPFKDKKLWYYTIYFEVSDMTILVPVDKAEEQGIRAIVPRADAERAMALISEDYEPVPADWKLRYQMNRDLLKQGSVTDIATVVRTLYHRSKVKELPVLERNLFDSAVKLLVHEVSFALEIPRDEVEQVIFGKLEADMPADLIKSRRAPVVEDDLDDPDVDEDVDV